MEKKIDNEICKLFEQKALYKHKKISLTDNTNNSNQIDNINIIEKNSLKEIIKTKNAFLSKKNKINNKRVSLLDLIHINDDNSYSIKEPNFEENNEKKDINDNGLERHCKSYPNNPKINNISIDKKINYLKAKEDAFSKFTRNYLCDVHNERYISYCHDCRKNLCSHCEEESHNNHNKRSYVDYITRQQEEDFKYRLIASYSYLNILKELIIDLCSNLINSNEIILKHKVKIAYMKFYKQNMYQYKYAQIIFLNYILQKEKSLLNFQILVNICQINFNELKFPESKDIREKAKMMIDFLSNKENYILRASDLPHLNSKTSFKPKFMKEFYINLAKNLNDRIKYNSDPLKKQLDSKENCQEKKVEKEFPKTSFKIEKQKIIEETINQTKITTSTNIFSSSLISKSNSDLINAKRDKKLKKITKKITKKMKKSKLFLQPEKINEEKAKEFSNDYGNFINENPPLNDGVEVQFHNEIKFVYEDKKNNKKIYSIYEGECQKGTIIRHGRGVFKWEDGEKYIGYWINNKREGKGKIYYSNGNYYEGMFKDGKKEGIGRYEWKNGDLYDGEWKNGVKEGNGTYYCSNGDLYTGSFHNDKIDGQGIYTWKSQDQYKGEFKNNNIDGVGRLYKKVFKKDKTYKEVLKIYSCENCLMKKLK